MKSDHYKSMLELVLNNIHEGVVLCDPQGKILFFNRIYEEIFNLQSDRDIGKNIRDLFPDARIPVVGRTGIPEFGMLYHWKGQKLVVNRIPVKEESAVIGVVTQVLFRDIQ
jgi:sensor histidine kinase regulating citrate/malate metabolism